MGTTLDAIVQKTTALLLERRYDGSFRVFLPRKVPTNQEDVHEFIADDDYGVTYDRSAKLATPALKALEQAAQREVDAKLEHENKLHGHARTEAERTREAAQAFRDQVVPLLGRDRDLPTEIGGKKYVIVGIQGD